jgi:adenylate kinase
MKPVYIIIGLPGAGKNTQGTRLAKALNLPHIDAGETFGRIIKQKVEPYWSKIEDTYTTGKPIPSEYFLQIIHDRFSQSDCNKGVVLTQNTKSVEEVKLMEKMFKELGFELKHVFSLETSREVVIERNIQRLNGVFTAKDPSIEGLTKRIDTYVELYPHIRNFYKEQGLLIEVDGELPPDGVFQKVFESLNIEHG